MFLSYQTRSVEQFGTLTTHWINDPALPAGKGGHDLLVGQVPAREECALDLLGPEEKKCIGNAGRRTWVEPTGGGLSFAPSLSVLRSLAKAKEMQ